MTTFIGIDPGKSGGIAWITDAAVPVIQAIAMPATERDISDALLRISDNAIAVIEDVHSFPGQGVKSMFTFGRGYGLLRGILTAHRIQFSEVRPRDWQKAVGITPRYKDETKPQFKMRLKQRAQQLCPSVDVTLSTADALLIARYAQMMANGGGK